MIGLLLALAPLILKIGSLIIDGVSTNQKAKEDLKQALQQWFDLHKQDADTSAKEHINGQEQIDELQKETPPQN